MLFFKALLGLLSVSALSQQVSAMAELDGMNELIVAIFEQAANEAATTDGDQDGVEGDTPESGLVETGEGSAPISIGDLYKNIQAAEIQLGGAAESRRRRMKQIATSSKKDIEVMPDGSLAKRELQDWIATLMGILSCILPNIRLGGDIFLPTPQAYERKFFMIDEEESKEKKKKGSKDKSKVSKDFPIVIGGDELPDVLQGVFWLQEQGRSSSIISFGDTNDGPDVNFGYLKDKDEDEYVFRSRVAGDRNWAFADDFIPITFVEIFDLIYNFVLLDGTLENVSLFRGKRNDPPVSMLFYNT
jgi:hypothetical protein